MSRTTFRRTSVAAVALAGAFSLAACNSGSSSVSTPSGAASTSAAETPSTTETSSAAPESSTEASTSEPTESSTTESPSSSESTGSSTAVTGPTEVTDKNAKLKIGSPAVIEDDDDTYRLTPTSLQVAPDSVFSETTLKKSNGTVYYMKFDVTAIKTNSTYFGVSSINGLFFHPTVPSTVKGAKRVYGTTDACKSGYEKLAVGQSASSCYMYQIPGATVDSVTYNDYKHNITWTK